MQLETDVVKPAVAEDRAQARLSARQRAWLETFEAEVASFPMSKYFDQVDSMVQFLYLLDHANIRD